MDNVYQPIVIEKSLEIIESLTESGFFSEMNIKTKDFAHEHLCKKLTKKFIEGKLSNDDEVFTIEEMDKILTEILVGTVLLELESEGIVETIEDENNEQVFFLTAKGKEIATKINEEENE
jgi:DNA-binding transcriptional regulator YhcF (GntR family)